MKNIAVVILAAGQSKRMKSKTSKVLHGLAGKPVLSYPVSLAKKAQAKQIIIIGNNNKEFESFIKDNKLKLVIQKKPLGTGHAVLQAKQALSNFNGYVLILYGDVPLIKLDTIKNLIKETISKNVICSVLSMELNNPASYGRILRDLDGRFISIKEAKDLDEKEINIKEVNSGIMCVNKKFLFEALSKIKPKNKQNEYYLTDIISIASKEAKRLLAIKSNDAEEFLGINSRNDLAKVSCVMQKRINEKHMENGVTIINPEQTYIDLDVKLGTDTIIWPGSHILGNTKIGNGCIIENGSVIKNASIADNVHIKSHSIIEESSILSDTIIGPFARIRPGSKIGKQVRVGNFVEIKKSNLKDGVKANHLTYLGDAHIGSKVNVGCGTITCNYDGANKHLTVIGDNSFIGSDTQFVAPVKVGKNATIGAGSTITKDVPSDSLALARAEQIIIKNWKQKSKKKNRK